MKAEAAAKLIIPELPELTFDGGKHYYRLNGRYIPSVTTVMRPLSADIYKDIDQAVLDAAAARGTAVHERIENYIKFGLVEDGAYQGYFDAFMNWTDFYEPEFVNSEYRAYHPLLRYAGTTDCLCYINGRLAIVDFKTTSVMYEHLVKVQLEAYSRALIELGIPVELAGAVQMRPDGTYNFTHIKVGNSEIWGVFTALLTVHQYIQKNKQWGNK